MTTEQVAMIGYSKVLTDSALQVNFFIHLHFFLKNAKTKVLSRPKPSVNMLRIHSGNTDGVNTSEIIIVTLRDLTHGGKSRCHVKLRDAPDYSVLSPNVLNCVRELSNAVFKK